MASTGMSKGNWPTCTFGQYSASRQSRVIFAMTSTPSNVCLLFSIGSKICEPAIVTYPKPLEVLVALSMTIIASSTVPYDAKCIFRCSAVTVWGKPGMKYLRFSSVPKPASGPAIVARLCAAGLICTALLPIGTSPAWSAAWKASSVLNVTKAKFLRSPVLGSLGVCTSRTVPKIDICSRIASGVASVPSGRRCTFLTPLCAKVSFATMTVTAWPPSSCGPASSCSCEDASAIVT
mmetsp:Transcript_32751/g.83474  ORF Transcript_32751/g.83474 Transcript_32751/m.83474 type:complete len:235 (-) Transcript_32751:230-934(-)